MGTGLSLKDVKILLCKKLEKFGICKCSDDGKIIFSSRKEAYAHVNNRLDAFLSK